MDPEAGDHGQEAPTEEDRALLIALGIRLRAARRLRGWTLATVARLSQGQFKSSAVANYERGQRAISAARLVVLAHLYGTNAGELLAGASSDPSIIDLTPGATWSSWQPTTRLRMVLNVEALDASDATPEAEIVKNFVHALRAARVDQGAVFTLRAEDVLGLARAMGRAPSTIPAVLGAAVIEFAH